MASNLKQLCDNLRAQWCEIFEDFLKDLDEEVLRTASNEFAIPVVDAEGGEHFLVVTLKIPSGSRDGDAYDGYAVAEDYAMKCAERKAKAEEKARKDAERKAKKDK
jgi:hypothetical protein